MPRRPFQFFDPTGCCRRETGWATPIRLAYQRPFPSAMPGPSAHPSDPALATSQAPWRLQDVAVNAASFGGCSIREFDQAGWQP
jgi:hypothetical protein